MGMIRGSVAAGLAGLGLSGGVGAVTYNDDGSATVTIKDEAKGTKQTVRIDPGTGPAYSCPASVESGLKEHDIALGRIKLTMRPIERRLKGLDKAYPRKSAPRAIASRYNRLLRQDRRLIRAYNDEIDARNAVLSNDCQKSSRRG